MSRDFTSEFMEARHFDTLVFRGLGREQRGKDQSVYKDYRGLSRDSRHVLKLTKLSTLL